jgi:predicted transcriptional regulator
MTISLPREMVDECEAVRKAEHRTRSELVREALRNYFAFRGRYPIVAASKADLEAIERGRQAYTRGEFVTLDGFVHDMAAGPYQSRGKKTWKDSRKRPTAD